ncbi:MAG: hypothetical protein EOR08_23815 [Mesorhizobium sp.]|nr:MAG: hypothetical protein EOR08_23815 [Mesorhizobium sp.]
MRGVPAWHQQRSGQHPSTVLALRANPPSPTRGKGRRGSADLASWNLRRRLRQDERHVTGRQHADPQPAVEHFFDQIVAEHVLR